MPGTFNGISSGLIVDIFSHCFSHGFVTSGAGKGKTPLLRERWWKVSRKKFAEFPLEVRAQERWALASQRGNLLTLSFAK
jgi:hypothetical protein